LSEEKQFGAVNWTATDIVEMAKEFHDIEFTTEEAEAFMARWENKFRDRITELGWEVWSIFLGMEPKDKGTE
jgi:hypothetical protein